MVKAKAKSDKQYYEGLGRRKEAVARVRLTQEDKPTFFINDRALEKYFPTTELRLVARKPMDEVAPADKYSVSAKIVGGGVRAQADALSHGIARALLKIDAANKSALRAGKFLTRDARIKERRKFGLKKARKSPQWSKR
jgi:small subunit ribosomal protein S9